MNKGSRLDLKMILFSHATLITIWIRLMYHLLLRSGVQGKEEWKKP